MCGIYTRISRGRVFYVLGSWNGQGKELRNSRRPRWFGRRWWMVRSEGAVALTASDLEMV